MNSQESPDHGMENRLVFKKVKKDTNKKLPRSKSLKR